MLEYEHTGFPGGAVVKNLPASTGDMEFEPWVGNSPGEEKGQLTPVFLFGESHGQRSLVATVHGVTKSSTRLSMPHT